MKTLGQLLEKQPEQLLEKQPELTQKWGLHRRIYFEDFPDVVERLLETGDSAYVTLQTQEWEYFDRGTQLESVLRLYQSEPRFEGETANPETESDIVLETSCEKKEGMKVMYWLFMGKIPEAEIHETPRDHEYKSVEIYRLK